jgi:tRNA pseudouridine38-40 synthase
LSLFDDQPGAATPAGPVVRVRLTLAYDGTRFHGIAPQPGQRTVGGELASALVRVLQAPVQLTVAGRTDAGVHARGQVVSFDAPAAADGMADLARRLTRLLGPEIVVLDAGVAGPGFDARHSATARHYRYTVLNRPVPDPFLAATAWWVAEPLDLRAMQLACDPLIGEHDFASFCRRADDALSTVRVVREVGWRDLGDGLLCFDVAASSFCQQMVRSLVGTMVDIGRARKKAGDMAWILRSKERARAGRVAPAHGLCLWEVLY